MTWMTAAEALRTLDVLPQTLYANVSRGKIRAKPDAADPRRRLYLREDVLRMARRTNGRRTVATVAAQAIEWGDPVLPSALSTVHDGRLWLRGRDAVALAGTASFEDVAGVLWGLGEGVPAVFACAEASTSGVVAGTTAFARALSALAARVAGDAPTLGRALDALRRDAAQVQATLIDAMIGPGAGGPQPLATRLAAAWGQPDAADLLRRALVLLADHELNASTFAARVAVSSGASLAAGALAGLATLSGPLHGGTATPLRALLAAVRRDGASVAVRDALGRAGDDRHAGHPLPGFGHPLYPGGDPRAAALLAHLAVPEPHAALVAEAEASHGARPNVDFALVAIADTLGLPDDDAPRVLFALGRCAGWLGHALEQVRDGHLIRPRARYVGDLPVTA